jgi:hypothetical protein
MAEQDDNDSQPTFGNCHGETLPESERLTERRVTRIRKWGQPRDVEKEKDDAFWENARNNGERDYERSKRFGR